MNIKLDLFNLRSHIPWYGDKECEKFKVSFNTKKSVPPIGLASYPRSGNTWMRHLIETLTGFFTGSVYHSSRLLVQSK